MVAGEGQFMDVTGVVIVPYSFSMPWRAFHATHPTATRHCWTSQQWHLSEEKVREKLTYMDENPLRAGLAARPCDWPLSSASYYEQGRSVGVPIRWIA